MDSEERFEAIVHGLEEAYRKMIIRKRKLGESVVISKDGQVIEVDANEMPDTVVYDTSVSS